MSKFKKRKTEHKGQKFSSKELANSILKFLALKSPKRFSNAQIISKLTLTNSKDSVAHVLHQLSSKGLILNEGEFYYWNENNKPETLKSRGGAKTFTGRVDMTRVGSAYIVIENEEQDVYVPAHQINGAMNRDRVVVEVTSDSRRRKPEGKIIKIEKRALTHVLGKITINEKYGVVYPALDNNTPEVYVNLKDVGEAKDGDYIVVEITSWGQSQNKQFWGKTDRILENATENELAMQSILLSNGFELEFPPEALRESEAISGEITEEEIGLRRDFRDILTFTIDPETAKDFDDALSFRILEDGHWEVGVHIADVTHFLRENSALDKEALQRSTSVYLVDRVLPMLPEKLSNDLCSLNPHEDKYTFAAVFTFDEKFRMVDHWLGKTIIHSDRRFSYEEAQERIETGEGDYAEEIRKLNTLAEKLRKDKFKNGAINFESDEVRFTLDENNKPIGVFVKERKAAHMLVEDFMLLANKTVATYMHKKDKNEIPFVYRVHDKPDPDKLVEFALFAKGLGFPMKVDTPQQIAASFNALAKAAQEDEQLKMLQPIAIRTMAKAIYTTENIGHYGLAFDFYTHFTSPIRRYSDVLVHRILFQNLEKTTRVDKGILETKCKHISLQEKKAMDAERDSVKYKQVEYMLDKIGQEFDAIISGMIDRGFFVEVKESKAEGLIPFNQLSEPFVMSDSRLKAVSRSTGNELSMGSKVRVRLEEADLKARLLYFTLITE